MTNGQKEIITRMREEGEGYTAIARRIGVPKETVKSFCRRSDLGRKYSQPKSKADRNKCPQCGQRIVQKSGVKPRRFCSSECRQAWWNSHPEKVERKAVYEFVCAGCGRVFSSYGNNHRKYCSHECYIAARFKGGMSSD